MSLENSRLLAVVPHPDDETVFMGGTLSKYVSLGVEAHVLFLTDGEKGKIAINHRERGVVGFREVENVERQEFAQTRKEESLKAGEVLGLKNIEFLGFPDQGLDASITPVLIDKILEIDPNVVISFSEAGTTMHIDHMWSGVATFYALKHIALSEIDSSFRRFFTYTNPNVCNLFEEWSEILFSDSELTRILVKDFIRRKKLAASKYLSQTHLISFFESVDILSINEEVFVERIAIGGSSKGQGDLFFNMEDDGQRDLVITKMPLNKERYLSNSTEFEKVLLKIIHSSQTG